MRKSPALARNFSLNISQDALCSRSDSYIMIHVECATCIGGTICAVPQAASLMHPDSSTHGRFRRMRANPAPHRKGRHHISHAAGA